MKKQNYEVSVEELVAEAEAVEAAVQESVAEALRAHKRAGNPVVGWHNERLEWVAPERIPIDDDKGPA